MLLFFFFVVSVVKIHAALKLPARSVLFSPCVYYTTTPCPECQYFFRRFQVKICTKNSRGYFLKLCILPYPRPNRVWNIFSLKLKIKIRLVNFLTEIKNQNKTCKFSHRDKKSKPLTPHFLTEIKKFYYSKFDSDLSPMV